MSAELNLEDKVRGCLVGLACGDAVGTTVEFSHRGSFEPMTDMVGGGPFRLQKGQWTDDTSMALCLGYSLEEKERFNASDQMERYWRWYTEGYMSSTGKCFDIGGTVSSALTRFSETGQPYSGSTSEFSAGNGALMRMAPVPIYSLSDPSEAMIMAADSTRTTHGAAECIDSSQLFCKILMRAFFAESKDDVLNGEYQASTPKVAALAKQDWKQKSYDELTGSGYVIESLESALWCFYHGKDYKETILLSANIGNDADTTAAICGQIAGAYYGMTGIPEDWVAAITMSQEIQALATDLLQTGNANADICSDTMNTADLNTAGY